jgi:acylphosphatase
MERMQVIVSGCVQGVGYRQWTVRQARFLGVTGWVRNRPDGSVEVLAEASRTVLLTFLGDLRTGPSYADVDSVSPAFTAAIGEYRDFRSL